MDTSFKWNNATFAVADETVGVAIDADYVCFLVFPSPTNRQFRHGRDYGVFLATVTIKDGDPGFTIPALDAPPDDIRVFYDQYTKLPGDFHTAWNLARAAQIMSANAPDLTPGTDPKDLATPPSVADDTTSLPPSTSDLPVSLETVSD